MQFSSYEGLNLQVYGHQVSGKTSKFTDKSEKFIYKPFSDAESKFFIDLQSHHIGHRSYQLSKFIPHFFGIFTLNQILHQQDTEEHQSYMDNFSPELTDQSLSERCSDFSSQKLLSVEQITKLELPHVNSSVERKEWIQHINSRTAYDHNQKFIKLKNLTYGFKFPNIMDLKLGIKRGKKESNKRKTEQTTTSSHGFRINGLSVRQLKSQSNDYEVFMSKYYCQKITQGELNRHLAFFMFDGSRINLQLLNRFIESLKEIILGFMSFRGIKFQSSSLYLAYDAYDPRKYTINFIDFDKYHEGEGVDESVERGLKSCLRHLIEIREQVTTIQNQLVHKQIMYFREDHDVIPQVKFEQYLTRNKKLSKEQPATPTDIHDHEQLN